MIIVKPSLSDVLSKLGSVFLCFFVHTKTKSRRFQIRPFYQDFFSKSSVLILDGLMWTVGLTIEVKLRFQISLAWPVWTRPSECGNINRDYRDMYSVHKLQRHFRQILPFSVKLAVLKTN